MSIDSSNWLLPDTAQLQFTVFGNIRQYHLQYDQLGKPSPNNFDYTSPGSIKFEPLIISRFDSNWKSMDSDLVIKYAYNKSYTYIVNERSASIKLDTTLHRIVSLHYYYRHGVIPSEMVEAEITISGLAYSLDGFSVLDSDAKKNIISASYGYSFGAHSSNYGGTSLYDVSKVNVSGSLNYNILSVSPQVPSINDPLSITQKDQKIWVNVGQNDNITALYLYSITGQLIEKVLVQNSQASFDAQYLRSGMYLVRGNNQCAKIFIP